MEWLFVWNRAGALTPFCSCSTIPILAGLLLSQVAFGSSLPIIINSHLLNPVIVILLWTLLGWKLTLYYVVIVGIFAVLIGVVWKALGLEHSVKNVNVRKASSQDDNIKKSKWKLALEDAWGFFYPLL